MGVYLDNSYMIDIAKGSVPGVETNFKFGGGNITTSLTTVWAGSTLRPGLYVRPSNLGETIYVSSSSTEDVMTTGTGAWTVVIEGTGPDFIKQSEIIELNGQTQVPTTKLFSRVCRAFVLTAASDSGSVGMIYFGASGATAGVPTGNIYQYIQDGSLDKNQSQTSCFTVPKGYDMYLLSYEFSAIAANKVTELAFYFRDNNVENSVWRSRSNLKMRSGPYNQNLQIPVRIPELYDIEVRGYTDTGTDYVTASYLYVLNKID